MVVFMILEPLLNMEALSQSFPKHNLTLYIVAS